MSRAFLIVMDSVGIGGAPDAHAFFNDGRPDTGANTVGHIAQARPLRMPVLDGLGLGAAVRLASGVDAPGLGAEPRGLWGAASEVSRGKDTPSGHWEIAGVPVPWDWTYFPDADSAFPADVTARICQLAGTDGILGNCHASGTQVIDDFGARHLQTGWPICYTSADSVLQIAAHEEAFGLDRLIALCRDLSPMLHAMRVGRSSRAPLSASPARSVAPATAAISRSRRRATPSWTSRRVRGGSPMPSARSATSSAIAVSPACTTGEDDAAPAEHLVRLGTQAEPGSLTFANFVEFDTNFGHRRDIPGYATQLEWFDGVAGRFLATLSPGDLAIFTADHGNDPSWSGTDHTRERAPVLGWGAGVRGVGQVGFADIGASILAHLGLPAPRHGTSFL